MKILLNKKNDAMQKLVFVILLLITINMTGIAQKGIEFGLSFTPATTWILNAEDFDEGDDLNFRGTFGFNTGLTLGFNFSEGMGIQTGLQLNRSGQNYINYNSAAEKADMDLFSRKLGYIRVPVLLKFNGDPTVSSSSYFRIGPHFDFLQSAKYTHTNVSGFGTNQDIDLTNYEQFGTSNRLEIYQSIVIGATLEMGGAVNLNESLRLLFLLHFSGSLTNPEGPDAGLAGDQIYASSVFTNVNPFPATSGNNRQTAWNVMGGITVSFNYVLGFE